MKPWIHASKSAKKYGGSPQDYIAVHDFFDSTKAAMPDMRHRAVLHSAFGIFLVEKVFGTIIKNSEGREVSVRDLGEDHVIEDLGFIPTMEQWLGNLTRQKWMYGSQRGSRAIETPKDPDTIEKVIEEMQRLRKPLFPRRTPRLGAST